MKILQFTSGAALLALLATGQRVLAGDEAATETRISGFVDASYSGNVDTGGDAFRLDQVELDVEHHVGGKLLLRADVESAGDGALSVEQGWVKMSLPRFSRHSLTVGKFNAPMGVELLDAPQMLQYSHSLLFDYGLPTNLSGALVEGPLAGAADYKLFVVNGWDQNDETNASHSWGGRLGWSLGDKGGVGLSFIRGREDAVKTSGPEDLQVVDVDLLFRPRSGTVLFAEFNSGTATPVGGADQSWSGWMLGGHVDFAAVWGLTLRYDTLADEDGVLFGMVNGANQSRTALAAAITVAAGPGRTVLLEARHDGSDQDAFSDGEGGLTGGTTQLALEFTQTF